ncbi:hypothetical protein HETIRDRAFT_450529 [Heterobasidion irregulare TC 32-1]|uniref:Uncharacterized protein n=1 Tax=Heterobasidion irregulare (strain TC 32-1) TaxID=747525 RepID=W4KBT0_HETIT|nr:uncharacterized protein HETIRDRAFT_450529 [Heterobasidion irregulare TC 32-1]ETW82775.1 hypothetical protein HETIRDRAFT_450529 [Heterobasidion irregulare TC 32-1]
MVIGGARRGGDESACVGRGDIFQASDEDKEEDAKGQDQNTESEKQAGEDEDNDLQECQSESGQNVGKSEGYGEEKEEVGEEKDNDDEDEEENDLPFSAEEAQFRVPDFLVILTKATPERNTQFRNALIFWELKDCQGHDTATMLAANEQMHRRAQIMHATIPQLVQQAQFLFEHSPEQKIALGMVAVGLFFHRTRMPALSRDGKLKLLPPMKAAKIPTISNIHPIFNESGTEYSVAFKIIGPFRGSGQPRWRVEVEC